MPSQKTLVLPLVAMGSVPQYAVQSVIDSRRAELEKTTISSLYVYPFSGREMSIAEAALGCKKGTKATSLVTPWELYYDSNGNSSVEFMQMHSPVIPGCESLYIKQLVKIIHDREYTRVVVLDARDKGLWHGEDGNGNVSKNDVLHWSNRTVGGISMEVDSNTEEAEINNSDISTSGNFVRYLAFEIDALGDDILVECHAVSVYEGWNGPAVTQLLASAGLSVEGGSTSNGEDLVGAAREVEGMYN